MKQIPLTQGQVALVDDEDFEYLNQFKWYAYKPKNTYYAIRNINRYENQKTISMHRVILGLTDPKIQCDHRDNNGLNNKRNNLRACTNDENIRNRKSHKNSSSIYKGIGWNKQAGKWRVRIKINKKDIFIGYFTDEIEAAKAYDEAAKIHHGEFANLNFK